MEKGQSLQQMGWGSWIFICKRMKQTFSTLHHAQKLNSQWIKALNIRAKTIKLLDDNIGEKLHDTGLGNDFLDVTPKEKATKGKNR